MPKQRKDIDGFIKKGATCEYSDYCDRSGVRCLHKGENTKSTYHCGYCKSFRMIDHDRIERGEETILQKK